VTAAVVVLAGGLVVTVAGLVAFAVLLVGSVRREAALSISLSSSEARATAAELEAETCKTASEERAERLDRVIVYLRAELEAAEREPAHAPAASSLDRLRRVLVRADNEASGIVEGGAGGADTIDTDRLRRPPTAPVRPAPAGAGVDGSGGKR
jgi:hypothetical protein